MAKEYTHQKNAFVVFITIVKKCIVDEHLDMSTIEIVDSGAAHD